MSYEVVILSSVSKGMVVNLAGKINKMAGKAQVHAFAETKSIKDCYLKVLEISKGCDSILFIDEMADPDERLFAECEVSESPKRFSMKVKEDCSVQLSTHLPSSIIQNLSQEDFYGILWGKGSLIERYNIETFDDYGKSHDFRDTKISFFFGCRLKYFIKNYGDAEDIEILESMIGKYYFSAAVPKYFVGMDNKNTYLVKSIQNRLDMPENIFSNSSKYPAYGKGLVFVPVRDMENCYGIRKFADSLKNQTYKNFDTIAFGLGKDLKDFSNYHLNNVKFVETSEAEYGFINETLRESVNYDWYCILSHNTIYSNDLIESFISLGKNVSTILTSMSRAEDFSTVSEVAVDKDTLFFNRKALKSVGYFDPVNYFGAAEFMNRCSSLQYSEFKIIPEEKGLIVDIELNYSIDRLKVVRDNYFESLKSGYSINPRTSGYETIKKVPLELKTKAVPISKGEIFVSEIIVRTLHSPSRINSVISQLQEREIGGVRIWTNTRKDDPKIKNLYDQGMVYTGPECYQCRELDCDHQKYLSSGQVANFYSMMKLFESIRENDREDESLYLIMEDDVRLKPNFVSVLNSMILSNEVLDNIFEPLLLRIGWGDMLEYRRDHYLENEEDYEFKENFKRFANPCFIVNKHAIKKYLDEFVFFDRACDQWIHTELGMEIKNFSLYPPLCDELSHVGMIESEMHPKASSYEYQYLQFVKTGNIEHYNESMRLKKEYDDFWSKDVTKVI